MAIDRTPTWVSLWLLAKNELRFSIKLGSVAFLLLGSIFLATGISAKQSLPMAIIFFMAPIAILGIEVAHEYKRTNNYPGYRDLNWRVYIFSTLWTGIFGGLLQFTLQWAKGNHHSFERELLATILAFGAIGALLAAIPTKRS